MSAVALAFERVGWGVTAPESDVGTDLDLFVIVDRFGEGLPAARAAKPTAVYR